MNRVLSSLLLTCLLAERAGLARAQTGPVDPRSQVVITDKDAYGLLPPELIAAPTVEHMWLSPTGRYLLVERSSIRLTSDVLRRVEAEHVPPPGEVTLVLWDSLSHTPRTVWTDAFAADAITQVEWMPQADVAIAVVREMVPPDPANPAGDQTRAGILRISPGLSRAEELGITGNNDFGHVQLYVSPNRPLAIIQHVAIPREGADGPVILYLLDRAGRPAGTVTLPQSLGWASIEWAADGAPIVKAQEMQPGNKLISHTFALDPSSASLTPLDKLPSLYTPAPATPAVPPSGLTLKQTAMAAKEGETTQSVGLLWLESAVKTKRQEALVSADASDGILLPAGDLVVYRSHGAVWFNPLLKLSLAEYKVMRDKAERMVAINHAKQVALGLLMYAQDNNETLPGGDPSSLISPYVNSQEILSSFNYTYGGGPLSAMNSPADTELGYVPGPGGRAIFYGDGHVKWKPD